MFRVESLSSRAHKLAFDDATTLDPSFVNRDIARLGDVAPIDVEAVLAARLLKQKRVVVSVVPTPGAPPAGRIAKGR